MEKDNSIFGRVLTLGPALGDHGGISSVLVSYSRHVPSFRHLPTNSHGSTVKGAFVLAWTMARMPLERLRGRRLLHVHGAAGKSFIRKSLLMAWGRLLGFGIIFHSHSGFLASYAQRVGTEKVGAQLRRCRRCLVLSQKWKEYFETTLGCRQVTVLPNIVDTVASPSPMPARTAGEPLKVLFLGKICNEKGIFDLVDVLSANADAFRGRLKIAVGGSGDSDRLQKAIDRSGVRDMMEYVGWVSGRQKDDMLDSCHLLILPSYVEGMPITVLEAMAHGRAVIASRAGAIPEIVVDGSTGTLFDAGDKKALADALMRYVGNPALAAEHGAEGGRHAEPFMPGAIVDALRQIYAEALDRR